MELLMRANALHGDRRPLPYAIVATAKRLGWDQGRADEGRGRVARALRWLEKYILNCVRRLEPRNDYKWGTKCFFPNAAALVLGRLSGLKRPTLSGGPWRPIKGACSPPHPPRKPFSGGTTPNVQGEPNPGAAAVENAHSAPARLRLGREPEARRMFDVCLQERWA
jgi:hypothetical protein